MKLTETFPLMYFLNLAKRQDRRARCEQVFEDADLPVRRFPAVNAEFVKNSRKFESAGRYAHAVSTRMIIRRAMLRKAPAVFIFEDDVVLSGELHERLAEIELPDDWGMFYLGCQHHERPQTVGTGLVRVKGALDTHAWGVRATHYRQVMRALEGKEDPPVGSLPPADVFLARLHPKVPTYAAFPNLAWQAEEHSDLVKGVFSNYHADGTQKPVQEVTAGIMAESLGGRAWEGAGKEVKKPFYVSRWYERGLEMTIPSAETEEGSDVPPSREVEPKVGFLCLTKGGHNQPEVWTEFWRGYENNYRVYVHSKGEEAVECDWVRSAKIPDVIETKWGDISLVRAQLALLREAFKDEGLTHFLFFSESCVPLWPFDELLTQLRLDGRSWVSSYGGDEKEKRREDTRRVPAGYWRFHSQWTLLRRDAVEVILQCDLTEHFSSVFAPDECYFGTVLWMAGFPEERILCRDLTWTDWREETAHPTLFDEADPISVAKARSSGAFFARKFTKAADLKSLGIHKN